MNKTTARTSAPTNRTSDDVRHCELNFIRKRKEGVSKDRLAGLAISGGGIRSATFALGVLETLKERGLLPKFHYLSTVSGGGYIGGWLSANCHWTRNWLDRDADWTGSIAHLRRYSNYLSPQVGFFSADTWSMLTIWLRNTLLIQTTVILALACALLLPRPLLELFQQWPSMELWRWATIFLYVLGIVGVAGNHLRLTANHDVAFLKDKAWWLGGVTAAALAAVAYLFARTVGFDPFAPGEVNHWHAIPVAALVVAAGFCLQPTAVALVGQLPGFRHDKPRQINYSQGWVQSVVIIPLMVAAFLVAAILWGEAVGAPGVTSLDSLKTYGALLKAGWKYWPFPLSVVFVSFWMVAICSVTTRSRWRSWGVALAAPLVAVPALHALLAAIVLLFQWRATNAAQGVWEAFVWGPPIVALAFVLSIVVLIGMIGRSSTDGVREWWSRLGAWLGIYAVAWMVMAVAAVYGPRLVDWLITSHPLTALGTGGGWIGTVIGGLVAGKSDSTGGDTAKSTATQAKEWLATVTPFVFIGGLLVGVAFVLHQVIKLNAEVADWWTLSGAPPDGTSAFWVALAALGACFVALLLMAARVDINEFSLNAFYRNRLVRCYLGAARVNTQPPRNPQNFTGFDDADDLRLTRLAEAGHRGPLHLVNCALNLGGSSDLALHTRHSAAFTLSPLDSGSAYKSRNLDGSATELGYITTKNYAGLGGPTLGQAIAVSGAAASPNMGYHTSPVTAFLLTLFNVRLGWWFPNPSGTGVRKASPWFSLRYLVAELFGEANDKSKFVMISDGGHFENLAAYELVRRQCRVIVVSDGECDPTLAFDGLGTLIRMCEVDFGYSIEIDVNALRRGSSAAWSSRRYAVGRIRYGKGVTDGVLIYLKASMSGHEDTSILQYKATHPPFPHETTGDQFYGEDQFESYRRLGRELANDAFPESQSNADLVSLAAALLEAESSRRDGK